MGQVLIRNLDDRLLADYKRAASKNGRSLEAELRSALAAGRPTIPVLTGDSLQTLVESLWADTPPETTDEDSTPYIRALRDRA